MCLLFMYINDDESKDGYRLIIADNRDEEWDRPTKPLSFWSDCPDCISGQDQTEGKEGGTWIGASKKGRIGILLNILGRNDPQKIGRGHLVNGFICSQKTAEDFIKEKISPCVGGFNSFNLILLDLSLLKTEGVWCTHYEDKMTIKHIHGGITTCDNSEPGIPWQKSIQNRERFEEIIKQYNHKDKKDKLVEELLNLLGDRTLISDDEKIYNQGRMAGRPDDYLLQLSAPFVWAPKYRYGTRTHSIILVDPVGQCDFIEKTMKTPVNPESVEWETNVFSFKFHHDETVSNL